jgi:serine/threonine protein kinase
VIHRDLKPANVLVAFDGANNHQTIKLCDFDLPPGVGEGEAAPGAPLPPQPEPNRVIRLTFPRAQPEGAPPVVKEVLVGCTTVGKERKGGNAAYEVTLLGEEAQHFACAAPKGSASPGQQVAVGFTFTPVAGEQVGIPGIDAGRWGRVPRRARGQGRVRARGGRGRPC